MKVNYVFVRHGYGYHNALQEQLRMSNFLVDPELTLFGQTATEMNAFIIKGILASLGIDKIHTIACSSLIRCMETSLYMSRPLGIPRDSTIFVCPYLREVDESSTDKYSAQSRKVIDTIPSYQMKSIGEQKTYLSEQGILEKFDFRHVEHDLQARDEPGDIAEFIQWFAKRANPPAYHNGALNVLVVTHAGVLRDFAKQSFANNSGFVLFTTVDASGTVHVDRFVSLNSLLPKTFVTDSEQIK